MVNPVHSWITVCARLPHLAPWWPSNFDRSGAGSAIVEELVQLPAVRHRDPCDGMLLDAASPCYGRPSSARRIRLSWREIPRGEALAPP